MAVPKLNAELREDSGTRSSRKLRRSGYVPGVIYGQNEPTRSIRVRARDLQKIIAEYGEHSLATLNLGGETLQVYLEEVQTDPVSQELVHVDLHHLIAGVRVKIRIPVIVHNVDALKKKDVLINQAIEQLEVFCLPKDIINVIELDARDIKMHKPVTIADLKLPDNLEILHEPDDVVVTAFSSRYTEPEEGEEASEAVAAEPVFETGSDRTE